MGSSSQDKADIGDKYDFTLRIELPTVSVSDAAPLSVLVSGTNPDTQTSSIKICSPNIKKIVCFIFVEKTF